MTEDNIARIDKVTYEYSAFREIRVFMQTVVESEVTITVDWEDIKHYSGVEEPDTSDISDYLGGFSDHALNQVFDDAKKKGKQTVEHLVVEGEEV